jgi:hypothetical protein
MPTRNLSHVATTVKGKLLTLMSTKNGMRRSKQRKYTIYSSFIGSEPSVVVANHAVARIVDNVLQYREVGSCWLTKGKLLGRGTEVVSRAVLPVVFCLLAESSL